jgi:hypothetical protein
MAGSDLRADSGGIDRRSVDQGVTGKTIIDFFLFLIGLPGCFEAQGGDALSVFFDERSLAWTGFPSEEAQKSLTHR